MTQTTHKSSSDNSPLPVWLKVLLGLAAFVVIVAGMRASASILVPFLLALFLAIIAAPVLYFLQTKGIPPLAAMSIVTVLILVAGSILVTILAQTLPSLAQSLPEYETHLQQLMQNLQIQLQERKIPINFSLERYLNPGTAVGIFGGLVSQTTSILADSFLIFLTTIFILLEASLFHHKLRIALLNSAASIEKLNKIIAQVQQYMAIKTFTSLLTGVLCAILFLVCGVQYAILWGLLTFVLNFVPSIGAFLAAVPPILLALMQQGSRSAAMVATGCIIINVVLGNFLEPRMMGQKLGLSTLVVFLSLVFWGWVLGPIGMLLSVPLTMAVKIVLQSNDDTRWIAILLGSGPTIPYGKKP
jgi:predicted PurR-regulated permease PerM